MEENKIKNTAKLTAIYSVSNIVVKMSGLILLPLYTSFISLEQYGLLALYEIVYEVLNLLAGLGIDSALTRWYYDDKTGYDKKTITFNASLVSHITTLVVMLLGYFSIYGFSSNLFGTKQSQTLIIWFMVSNLTRILIRHPLVLMRTQQYAVRQTIINILKTAFVIGFSFITIAYFKMGLMGIFIAETIANILVLPYLYMHIIKHIDFKYEPKLIKEMLAFSLPLVTSWVLTLVLTLSDRYIIKYFGTLGDVGTYTLAYKISNIIRVLVVHSFAQAYIPIFYKSMHDEDSKSFYIKSFNYYTFISIVIALSLTIFGQEAIRIVAQSSDYWSAYTILPYLVIGTIFSGFIQMLVLPLQKHKKTKTISIINLLAGIHNIVLNIILVPYLGIIGAALATALTNLFVALVYYYFTYKLEKIRYEEMKVVFALFWCIIISAIALYIADLPLGQRLPLKIALFISFPIIMYFSKFYSKQELSDIRHAIKQLKNSGKFKILNRKKDNE